MLPPRAKTPCNPQFTPLTVYPSSRNLGYVPASEDVAREVHEVHFLRPALDGSDKQVSWAEEIREEFLPDMEVAFEAMTLNQSAGESDGLKVAAVHVRARAKDRCQEQWLSRLCLHAMTLFRTPEALRDAAEGVKSAHWWIENRQDVFCALGSLAWERSTPRPEPGSKEAEAMAEALILPEGRKPHDVFAEVLRTAGRVEISRPVKSDHFREAVRNIGYKWDSDYRVWKLELNEDTGDPVERVAEAVATLVDAGYGVLCHDPKAKKSALSGEWSPLPTRWVRRQEDSFALAWLYEDTIFDDAKVLPGAKWDKTAKVMIVPFKSAEAVADFADEYDMAFTADAKALLESYREAFANGAVLSKAKAKGRKKATKATAKTPLPGDIDPDLMDTED